jgi:hypothetical protein
MLLLLEDVTGLQQRQLCRDSLWLHKQPFSFCGGLPIAAQDGAARVAEVRTKTGE